MTFFAKKSLGQNFLHAPQVISAMIHAGEIKSGDFVLEVGPGKGALTSKLLEKGANVIAVEKDDRAIPFLQDKFREEMEKREAEGEISESGVLKEGSLKLIHGDILGFDPVKNGLNTHNYSIIANIPYYISGEFLQKFLESTAQPLKIVVMLQKELAKRIVDRKESILSISVKAYGKPTYITSVPRKFFRPIPNVDSAVLLIDNISKDFFTFNKIDEKFFFEILKAGFAHKRKVVIRNLEEKIAKETLQKLFENEKWPLTKRAEELSLDDWKKIAISAFCFPQK